MSELAKRCERAAGPERELDCLIFEAQQRLLLPIHRGTIDGEPTGEYYSQDGHQLPERAPFYTASIDAALKLVPKGLDWRVDTMTGLPGAIVCVPNAWLSHKTAPRMVHGATPALALCAAALRSGGVVGSPPAVDK